MPHPSKRTIANRTASAAGVAKRMKLNEEAEVVRHEVSGSESTANSSELIISDPEDDFLKLEQPLHGWEAAERALPGNSTTNAGKTPQSRWNSRQKEKKEQKQTEKLQKTYGSISRFFNPPTPKTLGTSLATPPASVSVPPFLPPEPVCPTQLEGLPSINIEPLPSRPEVPARLTTGSLGLIFLSTVVEFESAFFNSKCFNLEIKALETWLKKDKKKVTGDWLKRIEGVRDLFRFHGSFVEQQTPQGERKKKWKEYSEVIAARLGKGRKYAQALRHWQKDWFESCFLPPCPMIGRHAKRESLFSDKGVMLAVREYLNTAMWNANPRGMCKAVKAHLQSKTEYDLMRIDAVLMNKNGAKTGIAERSAGRWLIKLGWSYGRNKKGYCDVHEREDVVKYREMVFCPRMKV
ncbi:hypothetical protein FN846DRAFT_896273 [Sphaerosporella brunnea]|uniref:Uncharacterized protein n=1 Tax=Sphaerosporella brunnea TaxID=1250544 RepID=A0A5J5EC41_9PEZI|nr:hypothetical protein FN846DRAFT_896273 [Sphaerosporella brunnea]